MNILFFILKIIGILLLVILTFLLILLFHPIFYKAKGKIEKDVSIHATVWWLFHIIRLEISVDDKNVIMRVRIFGKIYYSNVDKDINKDKARSESDFTELSEQTTKENDFLERFAENYEEQEIRQHTAQKDISLSTSKTKKSKKAQKKHQKIPTKISEWKHIYQRIKAEYKDEKNRLAVAHIWQEIIYLLKCLKPRYIHANMNFSTGDPATTGQVTGVLSMIPIMYKPTVHMYPDFIADKPYIRGNFALKGHIRLWHILNILIRILRDRNIKRLIYKIRKQEGHA